MSSVTLRPPPAWAGSVASAHFGRVYAAYGGVFVVLSLLWGWWIDGRVPDRFDVLGAVLCVAGVAVIMYWPRAPAAT